ncbi:Sporulation-control protein spo0M [Actinoplanes friuliensis DSM 7358]|uniref:Sporulation-control protein spo0M n=2 Tax=Actinoplanes friuliensis TaxID=196914 RepID=U5VQ01_9ACTN|nr:sporulation protein [Actinoplanes friuliensis]AGZ38887.1 Sporulation-control protein spo0M [Actinoplanes friuliensis DSM 7358]
MGFKKMLGAFGVGGPSVDTVLTDPTTRPGASLAGQVNLVGGNHDVEIEHITLGLVTRVEVEGGQGEYGATGEFHRVGVSGPLRLAEKQQLSLPFEFVVPWETPITAVHGQHLRGMTMGVRTEVSIARAIDKGDLDPVSVHPLPIQERILEAFARLGFQFKNADLEYGRIAGVHQTLPFYQEIEYYPPAQYAHGINEVELTFVTNPQTVEIVLEFDKRGGMFSGGHDSYGRYTVPHSDADSADWAQVVDGWVREALSHHQQPAYGGYGGGHGGHSRGHGAGGVVAGVAGGLAAGYVAGEVMEEVFEDDGGDE